MWYRSWTQNRATWSSICATFQKHGGCSSQMRSKPDTHKNSHPAHQIHLKITIWWFLAIFHIAPDRQLLPLISLLMLDTLTSNWSGGSASPRNWLRMPIHPHASQYDTLLYDVSGSGGDPVVALAPRQWIGIRPWCCQKGPRQKIKHSSWQNALGIGNSTDWGVVHP